jgi:hypothetical protein
MGLLKVKHWGLLMGLLRVMRWDCQMVKHWGFQMGSQKEMH